MGHQGPALGKQVRSMMSIWCCKFEEPHLVFGTYFGKHLIVEIECIGLSGCVALRP